MPISYIRHIAASWRAMLLVGLLVAVLSGALSLLLPLEYRAETKVFILSRTPAGTDPFTVIKSAERIGANLSEIVFTRSFFEQTLQKTAGTFSQEYFGEDARKQQKKWRESVQVGVLPGTGFLRIATFDEDPDRAAGLANAIVNNLVDRGWEFVGGEVEIKKVDSVVLSRYPVRPNVPMNMLKGVILGVLLVAVVELFRKPHHHDPHHLTAADWLRHL